MLRGLRVSLLRIIMSTSSLNIILCYTCTGGKFWRTSKIIRAVSMEDYDELEQQRNPRPQIKPATVELSDSDSDVFESIPPPSFKRRKIQSTVEEPTPQKRAMSPSLVKKITEMSEKVYVMSAESTLTLCEVQSLREMVKNQATMMVSPLAEIFRCLVCKNNMTSSSEPLLMPCCKSAIICRACLQEWFDSSTGDHTCPHCREALNIEDCSHIPLIRPLLAALENQEQPAIAVNGPTHSLTDR